MGRLVLWDVDGTLLDAGGATAESFDAAVEAVIGRHPGPHGVAMSGKTDPSIALEILAFAGLGEDEARGRLPAVLEQLEATMADAGQSLRSRGRVLPGVETVLPRLHAEASVAQTVLTGNIRANAGVKLRAFSLERWLDMSVGAFGSDRSNREELVPLAMERARSLRALDCTPGEVWVVGDTPRDLACARAASANCLLVATGRFSMDELQESGAHHLMEDLSDVEGVCALLLG